jgi:hypothetical protein
MRISVLKDDPGFHWAAVGSKVFFEGVEIKNVYTADEEKRLVVVAKLDAQGRLMLTEDREVATETRYGHVRVESSAIQRFLVGNAASPSK